MIRNRHLIAGALLLGAAQPAQAFGLRVHLYIADQVLADLAEDADCDVSFEIQPSKPSQPEVEQSQPETIEQSVPLEVCRAVKAHPEEFRAGAIGPDGFPDLIVGQSFVHPGTENGRQTGDWLDLMLSRAESPEEIAFAYGNMMHAAGDIFAHSYVNNYAGGVFELTAFRSKDIERRHTHLEKYIDHQLDYDPKLDQLEVPSEFVVETMVRTSYVPMNQSFDIEDLAKLFASPAEELGKILGTKLSSAAPGTHMMMMWAMLAVAEREQRLGPCNEVAAVDDMREALLTYLEAEYDAREADAARRGAGRPERPDLSPYKEQPRTPCDLPTTASLRGYPALPDALQEGVGEGLPRPEVRTLPSATDAALRQAEAAYDALLQAGGMTPDDIAENRRSTWWKALRRSNRRPLLKAYNEFDGRVRERDERRALRIFSDYWADDVRWAIMAYMDASLSTAKDIARSSGPNPAMDTEREGGAVHYKRWFDCYKPTFMGDPVAAAVARCDRAKALQTDMSLARAARLSGIGKFNRGILYAVLSFQKTIEDAMTDALFGVGRVVAPSVTELVNTLLVPGRIGRDTLDKSFKGSGNGQVRFECASDWIDADLGMLPRWEGTGFKPNQPCEMETNGVDFRRRTSPKLLPSEFVPLRYAIALGKLALLDQAGIKDLATRISPGAAADVITGAGKRYSVLIDTARSLDGSYQWNGKAMPPPREKGYSAPLKDKEYVRAGYPFDKELGDIRIKFDMEIKRRPGFPYYRTDKLRREVFARLFPEPFEGEILKAEQFGAAKYPFKPCEGDPFRTKRGGQGPEPVCLTTRVGAAAWRSDALEDACEQVTGLLRDVADEALSAVNVDGRVREAAEREIACRRVASIGAEAAD